MELWRGSCMSRSLLHFLQIVTSSPKSVEQLDLKDKCNTWSAYLGRQQMQYMVRISFYMYNTFYMYMYQDIFLQIESGSTDCIFGALF